VADGGSRQNKNTGRIKLYLIVGLALILAALVYRYLHARAARNSRELRRLFVRDIFAPAQSLAKARRPTRKGHPAQQQVKSLKLKGVIVGGKNSIAIIDDKFVRMGERINGYRVVRIAEKEVWLKSGNRTVKLRLVSND
jgi:hypothetical protein